MCPGVAIVGGVPTVIGSCYATYHFGMNVAAPRSGPVRQHDQLRYHANVSGTGGSTLRFRVCGISRHRCLGLQSSETSPDLDAAVSGGRKVHRTDQNRHVVRS